MLNKISSVIILSLALLGCRETVYTSDEELKTLPYVGFASSSADLDARVTRYNEKKSFAGLNLYNPRHLPEAYLVDMKGDVIHRWAMKTNKKNWSYDGFAHIHMYHNGDLLVARKDIELARLSPGSKVIWRKKIRVHHDVRVAANGDIYLLTRSEKSQGVPAPILDDQLVIMNSRGKIKKEVSVHKLLGHKLSDNQYQKILAWLKSEEGKEKIAVMREQTGHRLGNEMPVDVYHTNSIQIIEKDNGIARKGDALISVRQLDIIALVDMKNEKIRWSWGPGEIHMQHHPTLLANGNILLFDNGVRHGRSRILELDPVQNKITWEYKAGDFFSQFRGSAQRLPNGNTLVAESDAARAFEVTPGGEIVWEFHSDVINKQKKRRAVIYRIQRLYGKEYQKFFRSIKAPFYN